MSFAGRFSPRLHGLPAELPMNTDESEIRALADDRVRAKPSRSGHLPINGLSLYYEVYGELGKSKVSPLLLIPGAFMATDSKKSWVSAFAGNRAVIIFDQQGHGRTPDTSRKMSYEQFADDAAALLRALKVERADVM